MKRTLVLGIAASLAAIGISPWVPTAGAGIPDCAGELASVHCIHFHGDEIVHCSPFVGLGSTHLADDPCTHVPP